MAKSRATRQLVDALTMGLSPEEPAEETTEDAQPGAAPTEAPFPTLPAPKKHPGRPRASAAPDKPVTLRLPVDLVEDMQQWATFNNTSFTAVMIAAARGYMAPRAGKLEKFRRLLEEE